jgi:hypothetical protein
MDERFGRVEQIEQRIQMRLGIFVSHSVLPLEFKPAHSLGDTRFQHTVVVRETPFGYPVRYSTID